jgi:proteasome assembly chaperone (PAC2) family protein
VPDPLEFQVQPDLREAALLMAFEGWNDAGDAASSAVRFIERSIGAVALAEIDCEEFLDFTVVRPIVRLAKGEAREIEWPRTRFKYGAVDPSRELVVCCGTEPHVRWRTYADTCVRLVRTLGLRRAVLLGAYLTDVLYSRPVGVTGFASEPELLEALAVTRSGYEGPTGIVGVLAETFRREGLEVVSLWAALPHYISAAPNPRGTLALVQKVMQLLDLKLDTRTLEREASGFEERISAIVAADPELSEYVRQLKKREFAQ